MLFILIFFFFFFFQAEDGIRDLYVTGVQTCALPILRRHASSSSRNSITSRANSSGSWSGAGIMPPGRSTERACGRWGASFSASGRANESSVGRSEERRVGKECRSRWSQHHEKKQREW